MDAIALIYRLTTAVFGLGVAGLALVYWAALLSGRLRAQAGLIAELRHDHECVAGALYRSMQLLNELTGGCDPDDDGPLLAECDLADPDDRHHGDEHGFN